MLEKEKGRSFGQKSSFCSVLCNNSFCCLKTNFFTSCFCLPQLWKVFHIEYSFFFFLTMVRSRFGTES